jgi:hypothetical protein
MKPNENYNFQASEPSRNEEVSVNTTSSIISARRNELQPRKVITIRNNSPNAADIITLNFGANAAVAGNGIVLRQYESLTDSNDQGYLCWQDQITAVCATANGLLAIFER